MTLGACRTTGDLLRKVGWRPPNTPGFSVYGFTITPQIREYLGTALHFPRDDFSNPAGSQHPRVSLLVATKVLIQG